jgi:hypothetical protein
METVNLESWEQETKKETISVEQLDRALEEYFLARNEYEEAKKKSDGFHAIAEQTKNDLISLLEAAGKKNWALEGVGKVNLAEKLTVKVPKDLESKKALLQYFRGLGPEVYASMVTVNYMSLNSYYKQETENNPQFRIPGVEEGEVDKQLRFTRSK